VRKKLSEYGPESCAQNAQLCSRNRNEESHNHCIKVDLLLSQKSLHKFTVKLSTLVTASLFGKYLLINADLVKVYQFNF